MKKKFSRFLLILLLTLPLIVLAHLMVFPQETRCILIRYADFAKHENIYFRENTASGKITTLLNLRAEAERRVNAFWQQNSMLDYKFIYCNNENDFNEYGHSGTPAATQLKLGAYIVLKEESLDKDIIAHEISHTVLYNNIGWYKTKFKIPTWFDEGLAMQVDERSSYSIDTLMAKKNSGFNIPDVMLLKKPGDFFSGDVESIMLNYATAKYIVHEWLQTHSLAAFITAIKNGNSFEKAYKGESQIK